MNFAKFLRINLVSEHTWWPLLIEVFPDLNIVKVLMFFVNIIIYVIYIIVDVIRMIYSQLTLRIQ